MIRNAGFFIRFLWELPQNLLGLLVWLAVRKRILSREIVRRRCLFQVTGFGVSLGSFIFWSEMNTAADGRPDNREHEFGHSVQSEIFGPFYLILVGIPSVSRFLYGQMVHRRRRSPWRRYFDGYPENWADRLGEGVPLRDGPQETAPAHLSRKGCSGGRSGVRKGKTA